MGMINNHAIFLSDMMSYHIFTDLDSYGFHALQKAFDHPSSDFSNACNFSIFSIFILLLMLLLHTPFDPCGAGGVVKNYKYFF